MLACRLQKLESRKKELRSKLEAVDARLEQVHQNCEAVQAQLQEHVSNLMALLKVSLHSLIPRVKMLTSCKMRRNHINSAPRLWYVLGCWRT